jgi:hypothetical protein
MELQKPLKTKERKEKDKELDQREPILYSKGVRCDVT